MVLNLFLLDNAPRLQLHPQIPHLGGCTAKKQITISFSERHHLDDLQQDTIAQRTEGYLALVRATLQELANEGKLRDLDIQIATSHFLQTIAGIARWYSKDSETSEDHLVEQTVNYSMSAILKR